MNSETTFDREMTVQLERLAYGELDDASRTALVTWLDTDPRRWRLCGIAFLEAQAWSAALCDFAAGPVEHSVAQTRPPQEMPFSGPRRRIARIAALAGGLLLAFALGWNARPTNSGTATGDDRGAQSPPSAPDHRADAVFASLSVQSPLGAASPATIQIPVVPSPSQTAATRLDDIPEYVRQQWERRGYRVTTERRYLFAKLPDGRQVAVPVEQHVLRPVPAEVY
jgi:hypothetical protein